jgi:hypothetical protein
LGYLVEYPLDADNAFSSEMTVIESTTSIYIHVAGDGPTDWEIALAVIAGVLLVTLLVVGAAIIIRRKRTEHIFMQSDLMALPPDFYSLVYMKPPLFISEEILHVNEVKLQEFETVSDSE